MLQEAMKVVPIAKRWVSVASLWLVLAVGMAALSWPANRILGFVLAFAVVPACCLTCIMTLMPSRTLLLSVVLVPILVVVHEVTWLIPYSTRIPALAWLCIGLTFGLLALSSVVFKPSYRYSRILASSLLVLWWSSWGIVAMDNLRSAPLTAETRCAANLKAIGVAAELYEIRTGTSNVAISSLVVDGLLSPESCRCPLGGEYMRIPQSGTGQSHSRSEYRYLCVSHDHIVIALSWQGRVETLVAQEQDTMSRLRLAFMRRFGPSPWD